MITLGVQVRAAYTMLTIFLAYRNSIGCRPDSFLLCARMSGPETKWLQLIHSPLHVDRWEHLLRSLLDHEFVALLLSAMREGFRVGYKYHESSCRSAKSNIRLAGENPEVMDRYLAMECGLGRVVGPVSSTELGRLPLHVSRFGVTPKGHQRGKWRLIADLSAPQRGKNERWYRARAVLLNLYVC